MKYTNPVVKGFYPDPSVCAVGGKYYMVCSSFQYFPGVPLFESSDLVNWTQIGHVLTRKNQVMLEGIASSGGVFAPTIRFLDGRFYMVTTNDTTHENFYVFTDDIYGEWSDPISVDQGGIDPSLYFEDGHAYFISNGSDADGIPGVVQCEIDLATGKKLTKSQTIWQGFGGRFLESPHMYRINGVYYLMAAEGGTEYGHMVTCARAASVWGPFESNPHNPVLTNRNKAPYIIQGIGHGDLVQDAYGGWHILSLGFRQQHLWMPYHNLGREVFLTPVRFEKDGWFYAGADGTTDASYEIKGDFAQEIKTEYTFANTNPAIDWCYLRHPEFANYEFSGKEYILHGCEFTLDDIASPTFFGLRQRDFVMECSVSVAIDGGEAGLTAYMCENEHYDVAVRKGADGYEAVLKLNLGGIKHVQTVVPLKGAKARLVVRADHFRYGFYVWEEDLLCAEACTAAEGDDVEVEVENISMQGNAIGRTKEHFLGCGQAKYLTSEVSGGFTGVIMAIYAVGRNTARFTEFCCRYPGE